MPDEYWRWHMAKETGWTLEYIDSLSVGDWHEYWQIMDGEGRVRKELTQRDKARFSVRRRR